MMRVEETRWKGRKAMLMNNGQVQAVVLQGGGHFAEICACDNGALLPNLLWEPAWQTSDPEDAGFGVLSEQYGGLPAGPYLAAIAGHSICLDNFGPPSDRAEDGVNLHGEAAVSTWQIEARANGCSMRVELPIAELSFERSVHLPGGQSVLLVRERVENQGQHAREAHWVQHVCFGQPGCLIGASVDKCRSWPCGYEGAPLLADDMEFAWPFASALDGASVDLRQPFPSQHAETGFVLAAHVRADVETAWIASVHPHAGCALIYCFRRDDFPWVAVWEENCARSAAPWNKSTTVRGMEFGTTPMPMGRAAMRTMGSLWGTPVARRIHAGTTYEAKYAIVATAIPDSFQGIEAVSLSPSTVTLWSTNGFGRLQVPAEGVKEFLYGETQ